MVLYKMDYYYCY